MASGVRSQAIGGGVALPVASTSRPWRRSAVMCGRPSLCGAAAVRTAGSSTSTSDRRRLASVDDQLRLGRSTDAEDRAVNGRIAPEDGAAAVEKLRAIAEAAADRVEMHDIIGRQRDNWNHLLLQGTNSLTLAASVMAAVAPAAPTAMLALKASTGALLAFAAVTMAAVNKIQPSQLAEEQRNATRLWRQLERDVRATIELAPAPTKADVEHAMERVLALDAAYPLPLLPGMLEKFPETLEPTRWWPKKIPRSNSRSSKASYGARRGAMAGNGWTPELEEEMRGILRVIKAKDEHEYVSTGNLALKLNKGLAVAGPALAGTAALATAFIGSPGEVGSWASGVAVLGGALAAAVNTMEHGGQVGMVFELCRNVAGSYRKIQEEIEANLEEADVERRENGEVFQTKLALQLGRSTSELKQFRRMASPSIKDEDIKDFAGKLF